MRRREAARGASAGRIALLAIAAAAISSAPSESYSRDNRGRSATGRVAEGSVPEPIAVMPLRNINEDPELDWLAAGMSETMLSDLRAAGKSIVMRDALNTAIAEMALQGIRPTDESTAASIGRLVGAKTMVFGGYQTAAGQIRITARFVEVETSVVLDAAMVTGPINNVLALQDQIVARLLGRPEPEQVVASIEPGPHRPRDRGERRRLRETKAPTKKARPPTVTKPPADSVTETVGEKAVTTTATSEPPSPPRADPAATFAAYRSFSLSLEATSSAQQRRLLEQAIGHDPSFDYAKEALAALERRMQHYREVIRDRLDDRIRELREQLERKEYQQSPMELVGHLGMLFGHYMSQRLWFTALSDVDRLFDLQWPEEVQATMNDSLIHYRFMALEQLKRYDEALRIGEDYLREHTDGQHHRTIEHRMTQIIASRREAIDKLEELPAAMEAIESEQQQVRERFQSAQASFAEAEESHRALLAGLADLEEGTSEHSRKERELRAVLSRMERFERDMSRARDSHAGLLLRRCTTLMRHKAYRQASRYCEEAAAEVRALEVSGMEESIRSLRYQRLIAHFHLGEFREAIDVGELIKEGLGPRDRWVSNVDSLIAAMPADPP